MERKVPVFPEDVLGEPDRLTGKTAMHINNEQE